MPYKANKRSKEIATFSLHSERVRATNEMKETRGFSNKINKYEQRKPCDSEVRKITQLGVNGLRVRSGL